jgi:hypothetical protein
MVCSDWTIRSAIRESLFVLMLLCGALSRNVSMIHHRSQFLLINECSSLNHVVDSCETKTQQSQTTMSTSEKRELLSFQSNMRSDCVCQTLSAALVSTIYGESPAICGTVNVYNFPVITFMSYQKPASSHMPRNPPRVPDHPVLNLRRELLALSIHFDVGPVPEHN